jgi:hypothetical protein
LADALAGINLPAKSGAASARRGIKVEGLMKHAVAACLTFNLQPSTFNPPPTTSLSHGGLTPRRSLKTGAPLMDHFTPPHQNNRL